MRTAEQLPRYDPELCDGCGSKLGNIIAHHLHGRRYHRGCCTDCTSQTHMEEGL